MDLFYNKSSKEEIISIGRKAFFEWKAPSSLKEKYTNLKDKYPNIEF